jgi:hypothetical protein
MNSARFARCAVDCRPRSGYAVDKELTLLRIHFGFYFLQLTRRGKCSSVLKLLPIVLLVDTESKRVVIVLARAHLGST